MSKLLELSSNKGARKRKKRVGRGNAASGGTYAGRGMNGQNSRTGGGTRPGFEGGQTPLYRKMPKLKGFNNINQINYQVVNVEKLNNFDESEEINVASLYEKKYISNKNNPVKILGTGDLTKKLTVKVDRVSASAKEKIEKAKGTVIELLEKKAKSESKEKPSKEPEKETAEAEQK